MRTFPRELAAFRKLVDERAAALRQLPYDVLQAYGKSMPEAVTVEGRPATIGIIVQSASDNRLRIVLQGFMPGRFLRRLQNVALAGFYKHANGSWSAMPDDELDQFD
jgi:hypothetical protein